MEGDSVQTNALFHRPSLPADNTPGNHVLQFLVTVCWHVHIAIPSLCSEYCDYAGNLLKLFVEHAGNLYGKTNLTYNVHGTIQLVEDAKRYDCLDNVSAFVSKSYLGKLKKMIRKPQAPLQQVVKRLSDCSVKTVHMPVNDLQK